MSEMIKYYNTDETSLLPYGSKFPSSMWQQEIVKFPNDKHILGFKVSACLVFTD